MRDLPHRTTARARWLTALLLLTLLLPAAAPPSAAAHVPARPVASGPALAPVAQASNDPVTSNPVPIPKDRPQIPRAHAALPPALRALTATATLRPPLTVADAAASQRPAAVALPARVWLPLTFGAQDARGASLQIAAQPSANLTISAQTDIFLAPGPFTCSYSSPSCGIAPQAISVSANTYTIQFPNITAVPPGISCCSGTGNHGPDGGTNFRTSTITGVNGMSGIKHTGKVLYLVGVFLGPTASSGTTPPTLTYSENGSAGTLNVSDPSFAPALNQTFFIGDGKTGTGIGNLQTFVVPSGTTRLFLGFADAYGFNGPPGSYNDDTGSLTVQYQVGSSTLDPRGTRTLEQDCPNCLAPNAPPVPAQVNTARPINTRTGNYWTRVTDLQVETPGVPIVWSRTYASQAITETTGTLGYGWQHPYAAHLYTPSMIGGETGKAILITGAGNRLAFNDLGNGFYGSPLETYSTLITNGPIYTQTLTTQEQRIFDAASGNLTAIIDPQGRRVNMTYNGSGQLTDIVDARDSTRLLHLTYDASGRITTVRDNSTPPRSVTYRYDANGDLDRLTDVRNQYTIYLYQSHLLTRITNALNQIVEQQSYDRYDSLGKVTSQTLQDGRTLQFAYTAAATTLTTTGSDGRQDVETFTYGADNILTGRVFNGESMLAAAFDATVRPRAVSDANGNITQATYTASGKPLTVTDATQQTTQMFYDTRNNLTKTIDPQSVTALFRYDASNNLISQTLGITTTTSARLTTLFTYAYNVRYTGDSLLTDVRAPDGVVTHYTYPTSGSATQRGQLSSVVVGYGTPLAQTTSYGYDTLGRVATTTVGGGTALARTDLTRYNADNTVQQTIQNYQDGSYDVHKPDEDVITSFVYDALGRQTATQDTLGAYRSVTHYDARGRVDWTVRNPRTSGGLPTLPSSKPAFSASRPDANVVTSYQYDGLSRTVLVTATGILTGSFSTTTGLFSSATTRTTKTEYDALSHPLTTTLNYQPGLSATADRNVTIITLYDRNGPLIWQRDSIGRWHRTLPNEVGNIYNEVQVYDDGDPTTTPSGSQGNDADWVTSTGFDANGRTTSVVNNGVDQLFTATELLTDRITLDQYDPLGRLGQTTQNADANQSTRTDTNRVTVTQYHPTTGRVNGTRDPSGRWVSQQYDVLGRVTTTIQNCRNSSNAAVATGCAPFNASTPDKNVPSSTAYDALGRTTLITDALGTVSRTTYDGLGRTRATTQNYVAGAATTAVTNVTTLQGYNGLGQTIALTDALRFTTRTGYDGLGQPVVHTNAGGSVTTEGYDADGTQRFRRTVDGRYTVTLVDGLGRVRATITNYVNGSAEASDGVDQDRISRSFYDAAGRRIRATERSGDTSNRTTVYAYDNADRLIGVTENVLTSCAAARTDCNITTRYAYDRAGNRSGLTDANNHTRTWVYDAADQLSSATDALGRTTAWSYDVRGLRTGTTDPRGSTFNVRYGYDGLQRPKSITTTTSATLSPITFGYDALGRRTTMTDGTGTTSFRYDRLSQLTQVVAPFTGMVQYAYNARGERSLLTYPGGTQVESVYWPDGRLKTVTEYPVAQAARTLAIYSYDNDGRLMQADENDGHSTTNYSYDGLDQLRAISTGVDGNARRRFQYDVNRLGLRTVVTDTLALPAFPHTDGLDDFNRADGALGGTWMDSPSEYVIDQQSLRGTGTNPIYWATPFAANQEVAVTLTTLDVTAVEINLVLKKQPNAAQVVVSYIPSQHMVQIFTYTGATGSWQQQGSDIPFILAPGEVFGARAYDDGRVEVYQQGRLRGSTTLGTNWIYNNLGGQIGLRLVNTGSTRVDTFSGGTITSALDAFTRADGPLGGAWSGSTSDYVIDQETLRSTGTGQIYWPTSYTANQQVFATLTTLDPTASEINLVLKKQTSADQLVVSYVPSAQAVQIFTYINGWHKHDIDLSMTLAAGDTFGARARADGTVEVYQNGTLRGTRQLDSTWTHNNDGGQIGLRLVNSGSTRVDTFGGGALVGGRTTRLGYDGLDRLTSAVETGGTSATFAYTYDKAGNRTDGGFSYDAANQRVGYDYDAVGNMTEDEVADYTYDALNRQTHETRSGSSYGYNGDGVLSTVTSDQVTRYYTQDLAAPLPQVLAYGGTQYLYGRTRLLARASDGTRTWYGSDAVGSVRQTLTDGGAVIDNINYDPWGTPQSQLRSPFGFTGELQDGSLLNLRARWYSTTRGTFNAVDPYVGEATQPYTQHQYAYGLSDPALLVDRTGNDPWSSDQEFNSDATNQRVCESTGGTWQQRIHFCQRLPRLQPMLDPLTAFPNNADDAPAQRPSLGNMMASVAGPLGGPRLRPRPVPGLGGIGKKIGTGLLCIAAGAVLAQTLADATTKTQDRQDRDIVYRNPDPTSNEHPSALIVGFSPKNPAATYTVTDHVRKGSRLRTQFVSVTRSLDVARKYQLNPSIPIYVIDLRKVSSPIIDLSILSTRDSMIPRDLIARSYARSSQEVLVVGNIPPEAIVGTIDFMQPFSP